MLEFQNLETTPAAIGYYWATAEFHCMKEHKHSAKCVMPMSGSALKDKSILLNEGQRTSPNSKCLFICVDFFFFFTSSHCACVHGPTTTLLSESLRAFLIIYKLGKCYTTFRKGTKLFTLHTYVSVISANFLKFNSLTRGRDS